ncbi:VOC family protein [Halosegnis rubeus]|jgi:catechol 2,3-dioxygenase-like lactoylglutathione lyase family enzyme|uniref:VOC family protein n=1 Tax=Halosegnis rubeus TaxID=2212850 RepID=A0A5N5UHQ8_9EURY|nr:VOC family protein [Halosegnis rubeus]KAB7514976.1 VOC family protein [Halosegnis rubeus]KAB7518286.1 VOC family protein [Halosegnis rubeus]KAB7519135.1 VOC family protein [Halosegnis rubeus]
MQASHIDHVNLNVPADGKQPAREFYEQKLGFTIEDDLYEAGEKPFFDVRLSATGVVHLWPTDDFEPQAAVNYDHLCIVVEEDIETVKSQLTEAGVDIEKELDSPLGATGVAGAVYVRDPFGYRVELKSRV